MATFSITGIQAGPTNRSTSQAEAVEAIVAGEVIYLDTNGKAGKADCTNSAKDKIEGVAIQDADLGNQCLYVTGGVIQTTATITKGQSFILSTSGDVKLASDVTTNDWLSWFGAATAADEITVSIKNYEIQAA